VSEATIIGIVKAGEVVTQEMLRAMLRNARYNTGASAMQNLEQLTIEGIRNEVWAMSTDLDTINQQIAALEIKRVELQKDIHQARCEARSRMDKYITSETEAL